MALSYLRFSVGYWSDDGRNRPWLCSDYRLYTTGREALDTFPCRVCRPSKQAAPCPWLRQIGFVSASRSFNLEGITGIGSELKIFPSAGRLLSVETRGPPELNIRTFRPWDSSVPKLETGHSFNREQQKQNLSRSCLPFLSWNCGHLNYYILRLWIIDGFI
jgi:hypothetical protein